MWSSCACVHEEEGFPISVSPLVRTRRKKTKESDDEWERNRKTSVIKVVRVCESEIVRQKVHPRTKRGGGFVTFSFLGCPQKLYRVILHDGFECVCA